MDLRYSASDEKFRAELRAWLAEHVPKHGSPPPTHDWPARRAWDTGWQRRLFEAGYAGINWPREYGGRDASPSEQLVYYEETARAGAPYVGVNFVGLLHGGPTIIAEGNEAQRAFHLPGILKGEHVWCQGFSEPSAGSDLASLRTKAVRDGDHYVVSGQKIWTSFGHIADYCELLVRTDPGASKHKGITWLIMPMDLAGIDIRPLRTMAGSTEFCELFLDEVRIPVENRVGDENDGWRVTNVTLSFERGTAFVSEMLQSMELVRHLASVAKRVDRWDDAGIRRELGHVAADLDALWALTKRNISLAQRTGTVGLGGSVFKLHYAETRHRLGELAMRILDRAALSLEDVGELASGRHVEGEIHAISISIAAGTSQIQRNIISERLLGLPREPQWTSS